MAKKGKEVQLQVDITNDHDWDNLIAKEGLIVIDVYSEWAGPCAGMQPVLKKVKLEVGGDTLVLATARSDNITALSRFKGRSEPTWLVMSGGKRVNFMFGANAPKLNQMLLDELKLEFAFQEGKIQRKGQDLSELTPEEKVIFEEVARKKEVERMKEEKKQREELFARRSKEAHNIIEAFGHLGCILVFPCAKTRWHATITDEIAEAGLTVAKQERIYMTQELVNELFYFGDNPNWPEQGLIEMFDEESLYLLVKSKLKGEETTIEDILTHIIWGESGVPPGDVDSPAYILVRPPPKVKEEKPEKAKDEQGEEEEVDEEMEEEEEEEVQEEEDFSQRVGIWTPQSQKVKATCLRLFDSDMIGSALIPAPPPEPPHYAMCWEILRRYSIFSLIKKWPHDVLNYGIFTSYKPEEAKVVAKTLSGYREVPDGLRVPTNVLVLKVSNAKEDCILEFTQARPLYMSPNTIIGKKQCKIFFPDEYDIDKEPEEEQETEDAAPAPAAPSAPPPPTGDEDIAI